MIPAAISQAVDGSDWSVVVVLKRPKMLWITVISERGAVDIKYDRSRHTTARAYRGSALTKILTGQQQVVDYLTT